MRLVGILVLSVSYLEFLVETFVTVLGRIQDREFTSALFATMTFDNKLAVLRETVNHQFAGLPEVLKSFGKANGAIETAQGQRNKLAHGMWFSVEGYP